MGDGDSLCWGRVFNFVSISWGLVSGLRLALGVRVALQPPASFQVNEDWGPARFSVNSTLPDQEPQPYLIFTATFLVSIKLKAVLSCLKLTQHVNMLTFHASYILPVV